MLAGIELMHMIRKGQLMLEGWIEKSFFRPVLCIGRANASSLRNGGIRCRQKHVHQSAAYFSPSWTAFQADRGRRFSVIVDGISN
ncbi:MAG: hypothetical protein Q7T29_12975 [Gallionella sp.]|nr:hypothetical protein [Gallionella sp.]